jgi:cation:H+ antiporter
LGNTFVGTALVGLATSLPELVASIAAVRMGAYDLAIGNLFGSCAFNMAIFFPLDLVQQGSVFTAVDPRHVLSGLVAVLLLSIGLACVIYRGERRLMMLEPDSFLLIAAYGLGMVLLYQHAAGGQ